MKRRAIRVIVFLLLGAIVNVAVAWGLALRGFESPTGVYSLRRTDGLGFVSVAQTIGGEVFSCCHRLSNAANVESLADQADNAWWSQWHERFGPIRNGERGSAHGWPAFSLCAWIYSNPDPHRTQLDRNYITIGGFEFPPRNGSQYTRLVPATPLWPGFAINTIFYAAVLWVMVVLPFALRRRLRIRRGLCPACAYPGGSSPVCTECGRRSH